VLARTRASDGPDQLTGDFRTARQHALNKADITSALHHVRVMSPTRNHDFVPSVMPFARFPLSPELAALLICDYMIFDITAAPERITRTMTRPGTTPARAAAVPAQRKEPPRWQPQTPCSTGSASSVAVPYGGCTEPSDVEVGKRHSLGPRNRAGNGCRSLRDQCPARPRPRL